METSETKQRIAVIMGPTATGKSSLAVEAAERFNGEIISADSMQIYRKLNIGTAKATKSEMRNIRHYLIDVADISEEFSVARFKELASKAIEEILNRGKNPIIVGGTGLYIDSLLNPFTFGGAIKDEKIRKSLNEEAAKFGSEYLHKKLSEIDSKAAAKIHPNDVKRIVRALEIFALTGKTKGEAKENKTSQFNAALICLNCERSYLYERINERVDKMFEGGLIDEIKGLETFFHNGGFLSQSMQAIGYKEFRQFYEGFINNNNYIEDSNINLNENLKESGENFVDNEYVKNNQIAKLPNSSVASISNISNEEFERIKEDIKKNTRNYAKRQLTWFKKYEDAVWFDCISERGKALEFIGNHFK